MTRTSPKLSPKDLLKKLYPVNEYGQRFRHHTGDVYKIVDKAIDCKSNEVMAIYKVLTKVDGTEDDFQGIRFTRPLKDFIEPRFVEVYPINSEVYLTIEELNKLRGIK